MAIEIGFYFLDRNGERDKLVFISARAFRCRVIQFKCWHANVPISQHDRSALAL